MSSTPSLDASEASGASEDTAKRRQILEGARLVFGTLGFDSASMNDVTRVSGVSKSTLYVYFRSKEELFTALITEERSRYFERLEKLFTDPAHPVETLKAYGVFLATKLTSDVVVRANRTVISVADRMPTMGREFFEKGPQRAIVLLTHYIAAADALGTLRAEKPQRAAEQFVELATAGLLRPRLFNFMSREPTEAEIEETVEAALFLFMAGYGPNADRRVPSSQKPASQESESQKSTSHADAQRASSAKDAMTD